MLATIPQRKLEMKTPSTTCVVRSFITFRIKRGPSCDEASVNATIAFEKAIHVKVIMEAAIVLSNERIALTSALLMVLFS